MLGLSGEITGIEQLEKRLKALNDPKFGEEVLDEGLAMLLARIKSRFLAEEGPDGPWTPSLAGIKRKAGGYTYRKGKKYTGTGTLFESGNLFHSIQAAASAPGLRSIQTDIPYAPFLQDAGWLFMGFNDDDVFLMEKLVLRRIEEVTK